MKILLSKKHWMVIVSILFIVIFFGAFYQLTIPMLKAAWFSSFTIVSILLIVIFFGAFYQLTIPMLKAVWFSSFTNKEELCYNLEGKWDEVHQVCMYIQDPVCLAAKGVTIGCYPLEWFCPDKSETCAAPAMCISTCELK